VQVVVVVVVVVVIVIIIIIIIIIIIYRLSSQKQNFATRTKECPSKAVSVANHVSDIDP